MSWHKEDTALHKGLMKLLDEGTFELKAREVPSFISVYNWAKNLNDQMTKKQDKAAKKK